MVFKTICTTIRSNILKYRNIIGVLRNKTLIHPTVHLENSKIGKNVRIHKYSHVTYSRIGDFTKICKSSLIHASDIGKYCWIGADAKILGTKMGNYCSIACNAIIGVGNHEYRALALSGLSELKGKMKKDVPIGKGTIIGNDVWICAGSIIRAGVKIGDGAVIGAGAVVTKDVPDFAIVVGVPARILKFRFPEKVQKFLKEIRWWELDLETLEHHGLVELLRINIETFSPNELEKHLKTIKEKIEKIRNI